MVKQQPHVSATPCTQFVRRHGVAFTEYAYGCVGHGGSAEPARQLGLPEHAVVKTLVMQDDAAHPLVVPMHGARSMRRKSLARQTGRKQVEPCAPEVAEQHCGYQVDGTSLFGLKKRLPIYVDEGVLGLDTIYVNGGRRGYRACIKPGVPVRLLGAEPLHGAGAN